MKSFHVTVWAVLLFFLAVMGSVTAVAFSRKSNSYKLDTAQMGALREMARTGTRRANSTSTQ